MAELGGLLPALRVLDVALVLLDAGQRAAQLERARRVVRVVRGALDLAVGARLELRLR